jgi:hypothetical protein
MEMAEPLRFDSIEAVEHRCTSSTMCLDVIQFLPYMTGKTQRVQFAR